MRAKPKGKIAIRQELARKGVDRSIVENALDEAFDESRESDMALDLARQKARSYSKDEPAVARRKLQSFLLRRGFDFGTVKDAIEQAMEQRAKSLD